MRPIIMVLITSSQADDVDDATFEAEEAIKLETGLDSCSADSGDWRTPNPQIRIISSEEIGLADFRDKLRQLDSERKTMAMSALSEYSDLRIADLLLRQPDDLQRVSLALSVAHGGFDNDLPCWDADYQTGDLSRAISQLSEDEEYWLIPVEIR